MAAERVVTVGLKQAGQTEALVNSLMEELRRLVDTAGGVVVQEFRQARPRPDPATLIGKGKLDEIAAAIKPLGVKTVVFDDDLSAGQQKNIEKALKAKIIDRTRLILDIFAGRARTREGQLQIELAQLNYTVPRLTGAWRGFSQQMGGIGTRGPGERKIEVERRHVRDRIKHLKREIEEIRHHRERVRGSRVEVPLPQVALVGYTNVGKSTLLNALVGKGEQVYADDQLFATLDPTTRRVRLPGGRQALLTDTVGFIQKLPHDLVAAFRATLEEVAQATLLVHVVDATADDRDRQQDTVLEVVGSLGGGKVPVITAVNKADRLDAAQKKTMEKMGAILISARTGEGLEALLNAIEARLDDDLIEVSFKLPHAQAGLLAEVYRTGRVVSQKATARHMTIKARMNKANWERLSRRLETKS